MVPNLQIRVPVGSPKKFLESSCSSPTTPVSYNYNHLQFEQYHYHYQHQHPQPVPKQHQHYQHQQQAPTHQAPTSSPVMSTSDKVGYILNDTYYLIKILGSGACGTVYYAKCLTSGKEVAIKTMLKPAPGFYSSPTTALNLEKCHYNNKNNNNNNNNNNTRHNRIVATPISLLPEDLVGNNTNSAESPRSSRSANPNKALYNEVYLHSSVHNHPNVLQILQVLDSEHYLFVVLEYCPLGDLFTAITERNWYVGDDNYVKAMFTQLLDAVDHCHRRDVYHCDLKPENIMVDKQGRRLKIADFGLASKSQICTVFGRGSSYYMAPETIPENVIYRHVPKSALAAPQQGDQDKPRDVLEHKHLEAQRKADIEHRKRYHNKKQSKRPLQSKGYPRASSDVWALGVILLNLVFGRNPWKKASLTEDSAYRDYSTNPETLKGVLPVSEELNQIMAQVFHPDPYKRIQIPELRKRILACKKLTNPSPNFTWFQPFVKKAEQQQQVVRTDVRVKKEEQPRNVDDNYQVNGAVTSAARIPQQPQQQLQLPKPAQAVPQPQQPQQSVQQQQAVHSEHQALEKVEKQLTSTTTAGLQGSSGSSTAPSSANSSTGPSSSIVESVIVTPAVGDNTVHPSQVYYYNSPVESPENCEKDQQKQQQQEQQKQQDKNGQVITAVRETTSKKPPQQVTVNQIEDFDMDTVSTTLNASAGTSFNRYSTKKPGSVGSIFSNTTRVGVLSNITNNNKIGNTINLSPPNSIATTNYSNADDYYGNNSMHSSSLMFSSTSGNSSGSGTGSPQQRKRKTYEEEFTATGIIGGMIGSQYRGGKNASINHSFGVYVPCGNTTISSNNSILGSSSYFHQVKVQQQIQQQQHQQLDGEKNSQDNTQYLLEEQQDLFEYDALSSYTTSNVSSISVNSNNTTTTTAATSATNNSIDFNTYRQKYNKKLNQKPTTMIAAAAAATAAAAHSFQRKMEFLYYQSRGGSGNNNNDGTKMNIVNNVNYNYGSFKRFRSKSFSSA
ncbi:uncharacterized protein SAPINGB_P001114 [Magnusiomyces paraingens]|uniref:non-specific serine/threonine protein kinase n=1 Tax=Magnusiomyces paraingens TaxID=2606893 RepID=A0A5E8B437_9ASCO|nr:uncharacterized protein SAPINGB_P001114 [Saprochaete ingens]VVT46237.1 unnamed protein product [Saprochaete ingens]